MTDTPTKFEQTHISMILDRSGSMAACAGETINAVNKYLADARKDDALKEADFDLTIFDNASIDSIRAGAPITIKDITAEDFVPRGYTPLYDAIGRGIDSLDARLARSGSSKAVLVVVTDGMENASRKYNHASITELINDRQAKGWLVIFLGAGLDAAVQGTALGIRAARTANIGTDAKSLAGVAANTYAMSARYARAASTREFMESGEAQFSAADRAAMGDASGGAGIVTPPAAAGPAGRTPPVTGVRRPSADNWSSTSNDAWTH
jgi:uncharacterized protein YegL